MGFVSFLLLFSVSLTTLFGSVPALEVSYLTDDGGTLSLNEIRTLKKKGVFRPFDMDHANLGYTDKVYWLTGTLYNDSPNPEKLILDIPFPGIDHMTVYRINDSRVERYTVGDREPFAAREIDYAGFAVPLAIDRFASTEFFLRVETGGTMSLSMKLYDYGEFFSHIGRMNLVLGIYYGAVLIMLIYNFILFFFLKDVSYFNYVAFHFFLFFVQFSFNGLGYQYLWTGWPDLNRYVVPVALNLTGIFMVTFFMSFIRTARLVPTIHRYLKYFLQLQLVLLVSAFLIPLHIEVQILTYQVMFILLSLMVIVTYITMTKGTPEAKFYQIAWGFFLGGSLLTVLQNDGLIPATFLSLYGSQIGALVELALLSVGLAYRYKEMHGRLVAKDAQLRVLNTSLEEKVHERTRDAYEKNRLLIREVANKKTLLRELYHRVKNNLQVISSLLSLQASRIDDPHYKEIFRQNQQRIKSMSLLHEHLYQSGSLDTIQMDEYIHTLIREIRGSYPSENITFTVSCGNVELDLERAILAGLITNELVINAVKYAFKGITDPEITVNLSQEGERIILEIKDNGIGMEADAPSSEKSLGKKIVNTLVTLQLKGAIVQKNENGVAYRIEFDKENLL